MVNKSEAGHQEKDEAFFERNKTLIGAVVSILIAGMGFASALGVSYF